MLCGTLRKNIARAATRQLPSHLRVHCRNNNAVASDTKIHNTRHGLRVGTRPADSVCELERPGPYAKQGRKQLTRARKMRKPLKKNNYAEHGPQARDTGKERAEATAKSNCAEQRRKKEITLLQ